MQGCASPRPRMVHPLRTASLARDCINKSSTIYGLVNHDNDDDDDDDDDVTGKTPGAT